MKTNYLHIDQVHTWQAHKDEIYLGCTVYDEALGNFTDTTLIIPAAIYLQDVAGEFKEIARETYKKHLDTL